MKTIKSITEAFSMQPCRISVGDTIGSWDDQRKVKRMEFINPTDSLTLIEGYDDNDKILFSYIASAVHIHYF